MRHFTLFLDYFQVRGKNLLVIAWSLFQFTLQPICFQVCHCEERSDVAIQKMLDLLNFWIASLALAMTVWWHSLARNDSESVNLTIKKS